MTSRYNCEEDLKIIINYSDEDMAKTSFTSPKCKHASATYVSKSELRRLKNRASAERSRKVKDDAIAALQQRIHSGGEALAALLAENAALRCAFNSRQAAAGLPLLAEPTREEQKMKLPLEVLEPMVPNCTLLPPTLEPAVF